VTVVGFVASACAGAAVVAPLDPSFQAYAVTDNRPDAYAVTGEGEQVHVRAAADNTGGNTRVVFWPKDEVPTTDQQVCATWRSSSFDFRQEGLALRLHFEEGDGQAILITKNVWLNRFSTFNVSRWRASDAPQAITLLQAFDLSNALGQGDGLAPLPWRICARVVDATVSFVVWPLAEARPAWGDPAHGGSVAVPEDLMAPGVGAFYIGHVQPGQEVVYDGLAVGAPGAGDTDPT